MTRKEIILIVDDSPENIQVLSSVLGEKYQIKAATSGETALKICLSDKKPDLVLLDVIMPEMDGYEVCRRLKASEEAKDIPIVFVTAMSEVDDETHGLELGAVDYLVKPVKPAIVLQRVKNHLTLKASADFLKDKNEFLQREIDKRTQEIVAIQDVTIQALASLAETRDNDTGNHIRRTQYYVRALAEKLKDHPRFKEKLNDKTIELLFKSAPLHDIGKVGIPDNILLKPGRFNPDEFEVMKSHTTLGQEAIRRAEESLGMQVQFLSLAKQIALMHHEKWDGSGYPNGISGDSIPFSARFMALADVYDALISHRVYKDEMPHEEAVRIIREGQGTQFDPDIVDAFLDIRGDFQEIAKQFSN